MKILLAAASSSAQLSGVQRHAFNVARCLLTRSEVSHVHLVVAPWQRELVRNSGLEPNSRLSVHAPQMEPSSISRNRWYYAQLPKMAAQVGADVVHLAYPMPVNASAFTCPTVVTLHDLYPYEIPSNFGFPKSIFNRFILRQCLRNVNCIACVSEITRLRLSSYVPQRLLPKALRIYNCVEAESQTSTRSPIPDSKGEPFLLCVAQHRKNKNILFLLRIFKNLIRRGQIDTAMRLVIIGIPGPETHRIRRAIIRSALSRNVVLMEGLSEPDLQWCYKNCAAVLAPSKVEGFGLPVAEALLVGCRIVCSDISAFRELGGRYCHYVSLNSRAEDAFAKAIVAALQEQPVKPVSLPQLSVSVIAEQYVRLYGKLLASTDIARNLVLSSSAKRAVTERQSL
jgi:glycosyltransferase involved in cell wall biosynthesis